MTKYEFTEDETYFPVTMQQFETLTNEILTEVNKVTDPHSLSGDYLAQILMSALHAIDHKQGVVKKSDLFLSCINRISNHITYHAVEEIQRRMKQTDEPLPDNPEEKKTLTAVPDQPSAH